ncbi:MAG: hypothetical protein SO533_08665 [Eubacteriales bacterium]|nr:hypothetical protein [Clostridiales bacterium]MDY4887689.1 hypothetical protein [Eubacteriales bacterium]MDY5859582.1 hypothetical protein [Eubacteriales bacterium]
MAISNFISTVWSESLLTALDKKYIGVANCSREYEGDIKNRGDRVKICGVGPVTLFNYTKNTDFASGAETLSDTAMTLLIDQAKAFNFQIDDVDRAQSNPKLMNEAMKTAAAALATAADSYVYSLYSDAGATVSNDAATASNILDTIIDARTKLLENNVTDPGDIVVEVSPAVASLIFKGKLAYVGDEILESGCIGSVAGCRVYVSNSIASAVESSKTYYKCIARSRRAVAFAEQLSEVDAYRPEKRFADAVKGLHLYGAKVVYPSEMVLLNISISA